VPVDCLSMAEAEERTAALVHAGGPRRVVTLNPEYLYRALSQPHLLEPVRRADLVTPDGEGIVWAGRLAGIPFPERVTGIDLMLRLAARAASEGWRVYLLGAAPGVAAEAAERLCRLYPGLQVAGTHHGYFDPGDEAKVAAAVKRAAPQLLFVALGAPKQELWIHRHVDNLGSVVAMGVGGSFDVLAGRVARAPAWMRRVKLEWLGRLLREPSRWRRMLVLPRFAWLVIKRYKLNRR